MLPWTSHSSTFTVGTTPSGLVAIPGLELAQKLVSRHAVGADSEVDERLPEVEDRPHLREACPRVGGKEQVRADLVVAQVGDEGVVAGLVPDAVAPDPVHLLGTCFHQRL